MKKLFIIFIIAKRRSKVVSDYQERKLSLNLSWHFFLFPSSPDNFFSFLLAFCYFLLEGICCIACVWCAHLPPAFASYLCVLLLNRMGSCPVCLHNTSSSVWTSETLVFSYKMVFEIWSLRVSSCFRSICKSTHMSSAHGMSKTSQMHTTP